MATINGTSSDDFIHKAGDGLVPPAGAREWTRTTDLADVIAAGLGDDTIAAAGGADSVFGGDGNDTFLITKASDVVSGERFGGGSGTDVLLGQGTLGKVDLTGAMLSSVEKIIGFSGGLVLGSGQLPGVKMIDTGTVTLADEAFIDMNGIEFLSEKLVISSATGTRLFVALHNYDSAAEAAGHHVDIIGGVGEDNIVQGTFGYVSNYEYRPPATRIYGGDGNDTLSANSATLYGGNGNDELSASSYAGTPSVLFGGAGVDSLTAYDSSVFGIEKASDIVAGEVYKGSIQGSVSSGEFTSIVGNSIKSDVSLVGVTIVDVPVISGFSGTLTMTVGQLEAFDEVHAGAVRLAAGGTVTLAGLMHTSDLYLADTGTTVNFTAANVLHLTGYGATSLSQTGIIAGFTVHGGSGNDSITAEQFGYRGPALNALVTDLGVTILGGGGNDTMRGAWQGDGLDGGTGNDRLFGSAGRDWLFGSDGVDTLTGGVGLDVFVFRARDSGSGDRITDFSGLGTTAVGDRIRIVGGATDANYIGDGAFTASGTTELRFADKALKIDFDGDGTADVSIFVTGMTHASQLTQSDFF